MTNQQREIYSRMYSELVPLAHKLDKYYDIDKIKPFGIYVWGPDSQGKDTNIFDIYSSGIRVWQPCSIHPDALPIIAEIIRHLKKMEKYGKECKNE